MNITITQRSATSVMLPTSAYYENVTDCSFAAIIDGTFITGWMAKNIQYSSLRSERIKEGDEISELSELARVLTEPKWQIVTRERFDELFAQCVARLSGKAEEVQP